MSDESELECIYCRETKPVSGFDREHVIPEAFGGFRHAPVLSGAVCRECNSFFGRTLDLRLARGSEEGFQRYVWNVRDPANVADFRYDSLTFQYEGEGDYHGCFLRLTADPEAADGFRATPIDQVGFSRADGGGWEWLTLRQVYRGEWRTRSDLDTARGVKIYAADPDVVRSYLESEGVAFPKWRQMTREGESGNAARVLQTARITHDIRRVMAKIAFNYLAFVHGASFALRPAFDQIRRFVRHGKGGDDLVHADDGDPIPWPPDTPEGHRPLVHVVTLEHATNADVVIGQVCLFSGVRYQVVLTEESVPDLQYSGHLFNVADLQAYLLGNRRQSDPPGSSDSL